MSNAYKQQYGMSILSGVASAAGVSSDLTQLGTAALGVGAEAWSSGFSRSQESEADHIGLVFAAMAGYDPRVAVTFWQRMAAASTGGGSSIFSDHPSDAKRIKQIQGWMPEALKYYKPATTTTTTTAKKTSTTKKSTKR
jgi:predicted Zn-dependent protease